MSTVATDTLERVRRPVSRRSTREHAEASPARRWPARLAWAVTLVVLIGGGIIVWASPVLGLRTVEVEGSGAAALAAEVRDAVGVPDGTPLARIDLAAVRERVAAIGPVATAEVARDWPSTLAVTVTERTAVAVTQANGQWWLLDATGKPYRQVTERPDGLMPLALASPAQGDRATMAALTVLDSLTPAVRKLVTKMVAPTEYDVSLLLADGRTVIWGGTNDAAAKLAVLPAMLKQPGKTIDLSDPTLVTVRGAGNH